MRKTHLSLPVKNSDLQERVVHERYRGQWDAVIGEELECQHEHGDAATLKIFFNFGTSENFLKNLQLGCYVQYWTVSLRQVGRIVSLHHLSFEYELVNIT